MAEIMLETEVVTKVEKKPVRFHSRHLNFRPGSKNDPAQVDLLLGAKDAEGNWLPPTTVKNKRVVIQDRAEQRQPEIVVDGVMQQEGKVLQEGTSDAAGIIGTIFYSRTPSNETPKDPNNPDDVQEAEIAKQLNARGLGGITLQQFCIALLSDPKFQALIREE